MKTCPTSGHRQFEIQFNEPSGSSLTQVQDAVRVLENLGQEGWRQIDPKLFQALDNEKDFYQRLGFNKWDFETEIVNVVHGNYYQQPSTNDNQNFRTVRYIRPEIMREIILYIKGA